MQNCSFISNQERFLGLIADTHNENELTRHAVTIFRNLDIRTVLHAGDVIRTDILNLFDGMQLYLAFGNGDDPQLLVPRCQRLGFPTPAYQHYIVHQNSAIFLFHGYAEQVPKYRDVCCDQNVSIIIKGHTHLRENFHKNHVWVINPGALHRTEDPTIAILDTAQRQLEYISLR